MAERSLIARLASAGASAGAWAGAEGTVSEERDSDERGQRRDPIMAWTALTLDGPLDDALLVRRRADDAADEAVRMTARRGFTWSTAAALEARPVRRECPR